MGGRKGQILAGPGIVLLIILAFLWLGSQETEVQKISFFINEQDKIISEKFIKTKAKNFEIWFNSYQRGDYDVIITECQDENNVILHIPNVGQANILIYLKETMLKQCILINLQKFGVKKDAKQVFLS